MGNTHFELFLFLGACICNTHPHLTVELAVETCPCHLVVLLVLSFVFNHWVKCALLYLNFEEHSFFNVVIM